MENLKVFIERRRGDEIVMKEEGMEEERIVLT